VPNLRRAVLVVGIASSLSLAGSALASADTVISVPPNTCERLLVTPAGCNDASCQQVLSVQTTTVLVTGAEAAAANAALTRALAKPASAPPALANPASAPHADVALADNTSKIQVLQRVKLHPRSVATPSISASLPTFQTDKKATGESVGAGIPWSETARETFFHHGSAVRSADNVAWVKDQGDIRCNEGHGFGFSKTIDRCAFRDDPARGRGAFFWGEDNYTISFLVNGLPASASHHIHFKNTSDGDAIVSMG
jgi:hypothetical protein